MKLRRLALLLTAAGMTACSSLPPEQEPTNPTQPLTRQQGSALYVEKGVHYMETGQYEIALQDMKRGVELDEDNSEAYDALGVLYQRLGDNAEANSHFRKSITLKPDNYGARNNYGRFLCATGHPDDAFEQFAVVTNTRLYSQPWIPLTNAGVCARSVGKNTEAEGYLRRALEAEPGFPPALLEMARVSRDVGQNLAARGFLQRYFDGSGQTPESLMLGIEIEMALNNSPAAAVYWQTMQTRFPDSTEIMQARQKLGK